MRHHSLLPPSLPSTVASNRTAKKPTPPQIRIVTRQLLLRFVSIFGSASSFYLPLSVVPLYARSAGTDAAAGFATGTLLLATVTIELLTPGLVTRIGYRLALSLGLALLGLPALALLAPPNLAIILSVSILRGAGFAVVTVAGGALTASLIPPERRGTGLALTGVVSGIPALACLPLGVWISAHWGFTPVFVATAAASLFALIAVPGSTQRRRSEKNAITSTAARPLSIRSMLTTPSLTRPAAVFSASTMATGVLVTFVPLAITQRSSAVATIALFLQPAAATLSRLAAGPIGDRYGHTRLLIPGITLSAVGMAAIAATGTPSLVVSGAAVFGVGFGLLQNATLALMYGRSSSGEYATVSAVYNAAYDAGMGAGAIGVGLIAGHLGYTIAFLLTAVLLLPALIPATTEHRRDRRLTATTANQKEMTPSAT